MPYDSTLDCEFMRSRERRIPFDNFSLPLLQFNYQKKANNNLMKARGKTLHDSLFLLFQLRFDFSSEPMTVLLKECTLKWLAIKKFVSIPSRPHFSLCKESVIVEVQL